MTEQRDLVIAHLSAIDNNTQDWIIDLAVLIQETQSCDPAMASSRARDLSRQAGIAKSLKNFISGWQELRGVNIAGLTPNQYATLSDVITAISKEAALLFEK